MQIYFFIILLEGPACMFTSVTYMIGNALYSILSVFPEDWRYGLLIISRFTIGASAGKDNKLFHLTLELFSFISLVNMFFFVLISLKLLRILTLALF